MVAAEEGKFFFITSYEQQQALITCENETSDLVLKELYQFIITINRW